MIVEADKNNTYVTYLREDVSFDPSKIVINLDNRYNGCLFKPDKGFWGSPIDASYGWKEWCENEEFGDYDFNKPVYWTLTDGKILQIDWDDVNNKETSVLMKYMTIPNDIYSYSILEWKKMLEDGIVAVQLMNSSIGHVFKNDLELRFNNWDCESIVVLDKSKLSFV